VPITVAVDAMGGDLAPRETVAGAVLAVEELGVRVLLVGIEDVIEPLLPASASGVELVPASEVVAMHDPPAAVRTRKDSSIVVSAELVRDGKADAMTSAGNTGAAMAAALLRMGRIKGAARPAIAVPIPVPGRAPQILVDGGATVDCTAEWLRQFAVMGREYARIHLGIDEPRVALKTVEGAIRGTARRVFDTLASTPELQQASEVVMPALLEQADQLNPDSEGGCVLLGVDGICVIAHGSSNARAIRNSVRRAKECVESEVIPRIKGAIADAG
jgi:glycerol-3-phosphate acyltransferase PlsX